jgi:hypothetical protein
LHVHQLRINDRVLVVRPLRWSGHSGLVRVPIWTCEDGERFIGVVLDVGGRLEWVTEVEVVRTDRVRV